MLFFGEKVKATTDPDKKAMQVKRANLFYNQNSSPNFEFTGTSIRNHEDLRWRAGGGSEGGKAGGGGRCQETTTG